MLCGHLHRPITTRFGGTIASTCASTSHQVALDLRRGGGLALAPEPPVCMVHAWTKEGGVVTHTSYVDAFEPVIRLAM